MLKRSVRASFLGREIPVISAEELVVGKLSSERERDVEDARTVVSVLADVLDEGLIREGLAEHERLFNRSDLTPQSVAWMARYRRTP